MIKHPSGILFILMTIEAAVLFVSSRPACKKYFTFLPPVFWIYFLPMVCATQGLIPSNSPVYSYLTNYVLPISLFLLLITVDLPGILKLGRPALLMMAAGSLGIVVGAPLSFWIFGDWIAPEMWSGFGALSGSWTGGSANLIAVKEALGASDAVVFPMIIVDTIVPYVWMGILVALASRQKWFDEKIRADRTILNELSRSQVPQLIRSEKISVPGILIVAVIGCAGAWFSIQAAQFLPVIKGMISTYAWTIILVTAVSLSLSLTPVRKIEAHGSKTAGYILLYLVLTGIGAKADLSAWRSTGIFIAAGFLIVLIHAVFLWIAARWLRAPFFLAAVASQANVGGVASAPVVAEIYQPGLSSVGLLLAILGNIVGTYLGIGAGQLCRWVAS